MQQAPTNLLPNTTILALAEKALARAGEQHEVESAATAVVLCTWLLSATHDERTSARLQRGLGDAHYNLPTGDRTANLRQAIACYEAALQVFTRKTFPFEWAVTQNNLGTAYQSLPDGDREANLRQAIACHEAALQVRTREAFPADWAMTQYNLGLAYDNLSTGDREANTQQAIACYENALQVYMREPFPVEWAMIQNSLGYVYANLSGGDRATNLQQAIACYKNALQIFSSTHTDDYTQRVTRNLERAKDDLQKLNQPQQLPTTQQPQQHGKEIS